MASDDSGNKDLYNEIMKGVTAQTEVQQAVQAGLKSFVETADAEIKKLLQTNVVPPDVSAEMQKLQQAMIQKTIDIINNSPSSFPPNDPSGNGADD